MKEVEITFKNLFDLISQEENVTYELEREYFQNTPLEIQDEFGNWIPINGLIKKETPAIEFELDNKEKLVAASHHIIQKRDNTFSFINFVKVGNYLKTSTGNGRQVTKITKLPGHTEVFDIEVENKTHLYQCSLGLIHHNTLLTTAIIEYANKLNMKTITVVPSSSLLKQTHDYIKQFEIPIGMFGAGKRDISPNIVATWQTLQHNKPYIRDFHCIIWDEVHNCKAFVAQQIMQQASNSFMRIGLTGTIPKDELDKANLTSAFGPVTYNVKAYELQQKNILADIKINILSLKYPKEYVGSFIDWHDESKFLQSNKMFQLFMSNLINNLKGNKLILLKNVEPAEELSKLLGCTYISSKLSIEKRQEKFNEFVYGSNQTSLGTYSLLSTGIDIVHINHLILGPSVGKSFIKCIQSIGRGLRRKSGQKEHVNVIDLTSNLKFDKKHISSRKEFYKEARYPFEEDTLDMNNFK